MAVAGKIPVFRSVGAGIGFLFGHFFSILRASLVPGLLAGVAMFALLWFVLPPAPQLKIQSLGYGQEVNPFFGLPFVVIYLMATLMFSIALAKVYFGQPIGALYAKFGVAELRLLAASFVVVLIVVLIAIGPVVTLFYGLYSDIDLTPIPATRHVVSIEPYGEQASTAFFVIGMASIVAFCAYFFVGLRLSLFLPVIVKEDRIGLRRSWSLMRGNVWRFLWLSLLVIVVGLIFLIPVIILFLLGLSALTGAEISEIDLNDTISLDNFLTLRGVVELGSEALMTLIVTSLYVGAMAYAYNRLAEDEAEGRTAARVAAEPRVKPAYL